MNDEDKAMMSRVFTYFQCVIYFIVVVALVVLVKLVIELILNTLHGGLRVPFFGWVLLIIGLLMTSYNFYCITKVLVYDDIIVGDNDG